MRVYVNYCTIHVRSVHVRACAYSYVMVIAFRGLRPRVYTKKSAAAAAEPHVHLKPAAGRRPTCEHVIHQWDMVEIIKSAPELGQG